MIPCDHCVSGPAECPCHLPGECNILEENLIDIVANIESVEEVELGEIRKSEEDVFSVSQDPHDEEKVVSIVKKKRLFFLPFYNGC